MKKFIKAFAFTFLVAASSAMAKDRDYAAQASTGPFSISDTLGTVTINAAGSGLYNCLDYAVFHSTAAFTVYVLSGNTTNYTVSSPANTPHAVPPYGIGKSYCGSANTNLTLKATSATSAVTFSINYQGFVGK